MTSSYENRGVSAHKTEVLHGISGRDAGLFPNAFCRLAPDVFAGDATYCSAIHSDGVGTKSIIAHLIHRGSGGGDARVYRSLAQDSLVMNIDDLLCVGAAGPYLVSNTIGRNKSLVGGEVLSEIIAGYYDFADRMAAHGLEITL